MPAAGFGQVGKTTVEVSALSLDTDAAKTSRGVRDLATSEHGILILAGPSQDPPDGTSIKLGDYSIYLWHGGDSPRRLIDLPSYGEKTKPEGLVVLDGDATAMRILLFFDGPKEGEPRPISVPLR